MRRLKSVGGTTVHAIAGCHVVLLAMNVTKASRRGLLGFAVHRTDHTEGDADWLRTFKTFEATLPDPAPGTLVSSHEHPVQDFRWGDYTAKPDHDYSYRVVPVYGAPAQLQYGRPVEVRISTSSGDQGTHAIFFNRGVAGSQAYARKFGNVAPSDIKETQKRAEAYAWLSRGLEEAILAFIGRAESSRYSLRASVYEFSWLPVLQAFKDAAAHGADVKIVYDHRKDDAGPSAATLRAARKVGIVRLLIPRKEGRSYISHNKFIVLLKDDKPIEVWTGSTNFTEGGIFGQSNVGHWIRDRDVASEYLAYWDRLSSDPKTPALRKDNVMVSPDPIGAPKRNSTTMIFSPRTSLGALDWYAERMGAATLSVGFTAAFGISRSLADVLLDERPYLRHIMVESAGSKTVPRATQDNPTPKSQAQIFDEIRANPANRVAVGSVLRVATRRTAGDDEGNAVGTQLHRWLQEKLTGLNVHVKYLHTKYLLVDPLGGRPLVVTGSANFSKASTLNNDENMVVVDGNTELADVFIGEFMRLFDHFYFREMASRLAKHRSGRATRSPYLRPDDSWTDRYFVEGSAHFLEREMFVGKRAAARVGGSREVARGGR